MIDPVSGNGEPPRVRGTTWLVMACVAFAFVVMNLWDIVSTAARSELGILSLCHAAIRGGGDVFVVLGWPLIMVEDGEWDRVAIAVNAGLLVLLLGGAGLAVERRIRRNEWSPRFTVRQLFLVTTVLAVYFAEERPLDDHAACVNYTGFKVINLCDAVMLCGVAMLVDSAFFLMEAAIKSRVAEKAPEGEGRKPERNESRDEL